MVVVGRHEIRSGHRPKLRQTCTCLASLITTTSDGCPKSPHMRMLGDNNKVKGSGGDRIRVVCIAEANKDIMAR